MPVPEPIAPKKSARTARPATQTPPEAAAIGIYEFNFFTIASSLCPSIASSYSTSWRATSLELVPDTSSQILEKKAQAQTVNAM